MLNEILSDCCQAVLIPLKNNPSEVRCSACGKRYRVVECEGVSYDIMEHLRQREQQRSGSDYEAEHLRQKEQQHRKRKLINIEDDGEPFWDYVNRVFWRPYRFLVCLMVLMIVSMMLYFSGIFDSIIASDPDAPPWWWWFRFYG